jgi:hypothetical protein
VQEGHAFLYGTETEANIVLTVIPEAAAVVLDVMPDRAATQCLLPCYPE